MARSSAGPAADPNGPNDAAIEAAFEATPDTVVAEILDGELGTVGRGGQHDVPMQALPG
jgi:hypothetical protein